MKTIASIIEIFGGPNGIYASIHNPGYMRLVIEDIVSGPRGYHAISVAHYYELNGDLCQDPEIGLELVPQTDGSTAYEPFFFQMALPPIYQEVYPAGPSSENLALQRELLDFLKTWDSNLQAQGFLEAAQNTRAHDEQTKYSATGE